MKQAIICANVRMIDWRELTPYYTCDHCSNDCVVVATNYLFANCSWQTDKLSFCQIKTIITTRIILLSHYRWNWHIMSWYIRTWQEWHVENILPKSVWQQCGFASSRISPMTWDHSPHKGTSMCPHVMTSSCTTCNPSHLFINNAPSNQIYYPYHAWYNNYTATFMEMYVAPLYNTMVSKYTGTYTATKQSIPKPPANSMGYIAWSKNNKDSSHSGSGRFSAYKSEDTVHHDLFILYKTGLFQCRHIWLFMIRKNAMQPKYETQGRHTELHFFRVYMK